jgi:hypothetical protein
MSLPKNKVERRKAFFSFLLLFALSTAIIVLLAFSSTRVPVKQNSILQKQVSVLDREREFSNNFTSQMAGVVKLLDTINSKATDPNVLDAQISSDLPKLSVMITTDSVYNKDLYIRVVYALTQLQNVKRELRMNTAIGGDINECKKQILLLNTQLEDVKKDRDRIQAEYIKALKQ